MNTKTIISLLTFMCIAHVDNLFGEQVQIDLTPPALQKKDEEREAIKKSNAKLGILDLVAQDKFSGDGNHERRSVLEADTPDAKHGKWVQKTFNPKHDPLK